MISSQANNKLFNILLTRNVVGSHKLYDEDYASKLLFELIMKFKRVAFKEKTNSNNYNFSTTNGFEIKII